MNEMDKQKEETQKKKPAEVRHTKGDTRKPETRHAVSGTDREAVKDKGYAGRIEEKTKEH
jgi:hypothetical protein